MLMGLLNNFCQWTTWPVSPLLLQWAVLPAYFIYSSFTPTTEIVRVSTQVFSPDPGPQCWWQMFTSLPVPQEQFPDKTCWMIKMFWRTTFTSLQWLILWSIVDSSCYEEIVTQLRWIIVHRIIQTTASYKDLNILFQLLIWFSLPRMPSLISCMGFIYFLCDV